MGALCAAAHQKRNSLRLTVEGWMLVPIAYAGSRLKGATKLQKEFKTTLR